jgi:hypothetical protein
MYNVGADGDRQAFPLAWKALKRPYHLVQTAPASAGYRTPAATAGSTAAAAAAAAAAVAEAKQRGGLWCGATEVQHDLSGRPLFLHRTMDKLNKRAVRPAGAAPDAPRVVPWETVHRWTSGEVGVWGETRVEYGCKPRSTVWLAGCARSLPCLLPPPPPPPPSLLPLLLQPQEGQSWADWHCVHHWLLQEHERRGLRAVLRGHRVGGKPQRSSRGCTGPPATLALI